MPPARPLRRLAPFTLPLLVLALASPAAGVAGLLDATTTEPLRDVAVPQVEAPAPSTPRAPEPEPVVVARPTPSGEAEEAAPSAAPSTTPAQASVEILPRASPDPKHDHAAVAGTARALSPVAPMAAALGVAGTLVGGAVGLGYALARWMPAHRLEAAAPARTEFQLVATRTAARVAQAPAAPRRAPAMGVREGVGVLALAAFVLALGALFPRKGR